MSLTTDDKQYITQAITTESTRLEKMILSESTRLEILMEDHHSDTTRILELLTEHLATNSTVNTV